MNIINQKKSVYLQRMAADTVRCPIVRIFEQHPEYLKNRKHHTLIGMELQGPSRILIPH